MERGRAELANVEEARARVESSLPEVAERERVVSEREARVVAVAQAVAAEALAQAVAVERHEQEKAAVEQQAAEADAPARGFGGEMSDPEARVQWLTEAVKAAAKRAETGIKEVRQQARLILADGRAGRGRPAENGQPNEPVEELDSAPR